ncbi:hypothetical protein HDN1F_09070 [gamma proteobacterium HdN1]|nr:hypothetical protein HDN1F_09070 [gamma proteobacterium HdN1]
MTVLRNFMLAMLAFLATAIAFHLYLLQALSPDKLRASLTVDGQAGDAWEFAQNPPLLVQVFKDFLAANRVPVGVGGERGVLAANEIQIPDWLVLQFDLLAASQKRTLSESDRRELAKALVAVYELESDGASLVAPSFTNTNAPAVRLQHYADVAKAEWRFRALLGIGLADFTRSLSTQDARRLMKARDGEAVVSQAYH